MLEMVRNNHKREELFKQMDVVMKKDDFYFLNKPFSTHTHTGKTTMRSKTSSHKEKHSHYPESRFFESREDVRYGMNSTRGHGKRHPPG